MKRFLKYMMLSAAAIAAVACAKETVVKPEGEEPAGEGTITQNNWSNNANADIFYFSSVHKSRKNWKR